MLVLKSSKEVGRVVTLALYLQKNIESNFKISWLCQIMLSAEGRGQLCKEPTSYCRLKYYSTSSNGA